MASEDGKVSRRSFLKRATAVSVGALATRGVYQVLEEFDIVRPASAWAATATRPQEQYLVEQVQVIVDNGVSVAIPPLYNDVITAKLKSGRRWTTSALKTAQTRLENALAVVERAYPPTAAGLTIVVGWGLPFFRGFLPASLWQANLPVDQALSQQTGTTQYAVLDAIGFPSDPADLLLEDNHLVFKFRSDSQAILTSVEGALLTNQNSGAFVGNLFDLTSQRVGFLGRGFGTPSIAKQLALQAGVADADKVPDNSQLMLGFTSTQTAALGPDNIVSFETLPGVTNQWPSGYFANGCAMHLSHLFEDLSLWYDSFDYAGRVARMFSPHTPSPPTPARSRYPTAPLMSPRWIRSSRTPPAACSATTRPCSRPPGCPSTSPTTTGGCGPRGQRFLCGRTSTPWTTRSSGRPTPPETGSAAPRPRGCTLRSSCRPAASSTPPGWPWTACCPTAPTCVWIPTTFRTRPTGSTR
jgi:hypothetical protein